MTESVRVGTREGGRGFNEGDRIRKIGFCKLRPNSWFCVCSTAKMYVMSFESSLPVG